jgi:hypothetical protein
MSMLSGLQQDVLSLYRRILREAMKKDRLELKQRRLQKSVDTNGTGNTSIAQHESNKNSFLELRRHSSERISTATSYPAMPLTTTAYAIVEFRKQALSVQRSDFKKIDYMIRKGDKQIKLLRMPGVRLVSGTMLTSSLNNCKVINK